MRDGVTGGVPDQHRVRRLRGGRGLGDTIYLRPIADALHRAGHTVVVLSDYRGVFLGSAAVVHPFRRIRTEVIAHYIGGKRNPETTQWQDVCESAGVHVPLHFDWKVRNTTLVRGLRAQAGNRPMVLVHGGRAPMQRTDGFGVELMPRQSAFDKVLRAMRAAGAFLVQVGKASQIYPLETEVDLNGRTTVSDLMDLGFSCDGVVAQCSFCVPLAEAFSKPLLALWGSHYTNSPEQFVRLTSPQKVLSGPKDRCLMDDLDTWTLGESARAFVDTVRVKEAA